MQGALSKLVEKFTLVYYERKIEIELEPNPYAQQGQREISRTPCRCCGQTVHVEYGPLEWIQPRFHWAVYPNPDARRVDLGGFNGLTLDDRGLATFLKAYKKKGYEISHD
jgi:hypothetical protein